MHGRIPFSLAFAHPASPPFRIRLCCVIIHTTLPSSPMRLGCAAPRPPCSVDIRSLISPVLCYSPSVPLQGRTEQLLGASKISFLAQPRSECWVEGWVVSSEVKRVNARRAVEMARGREDMEPSRENKRGKSLVELECQRAL